MAQPLVVIAYANNPEHPLPGLREEDDQVHQYLQSRSAIQPFRIVRESFATRDRLVALLTTPEDRDSLVMFSYSGHAAGDRLITENETTNASGLSSLLSQCASLKLVVLNGCSTVGQVKLIMSAFEKQNRPAPVIVATSATVGDGAAKDFGITFFRQLFLYNSSLERAFDTALGAAQTQVAGSEILVDKGAGRGAVDLSVDDDRVWGIYPSSGDSENSLNWTLSRELSPQTAVAYEPNRELFRSLIVTLRKFNPRIQEIWDNEQGMLNDFSPYDDDLLKSFPHPISVQLRKLRAIRGRSDGEEMKFYNQAGRDRLWQLLRTYQTIINIMMGILQAEWWNSLSSSPIMDSSTVGSAGLSGYGQRPKYELASQLADKLREHQNTLFVTELMSNESLFAQIAKSGVYFDGLQAGIERMSESEANGGCQLAEKHLSELLKNVAFLTQYKLISVKNISIVKNRVATQPRYTHRIYQYWQTYLDPILRNTTSDYFLDNTSVLLQKKTGSPSEYLNLSPFLIDENTFQEKATLSNLFAWQVIRRNGEELVYEHLLRYDGPRLTLCEVDPTIATDEEQQRNLLYFEMKKQLDAYFGLKEPQTSARA
ncbi:hypothetical protein [Spirosoma pollinicola]|uniref:CHAT domain-containing protein n=1 Tax=Spirosoma pollinicola TaxID=2057025 RepID=A0A2K8Z1F3_9BACT|nr:hypothetical protein [Spirosoma pollinicola]AUD03669.1 hypothetical protein CWM47_18655 [Spirosoma pollinicola]